MAPRRRTGIIAVLGFAFAAEGALYSAITPILPLLARRLDMSESQAGLMLSSYSAGLVAGSLLCVLVLRRFNPRDVAVGTLVLLATSTLAFAWSNDFQLALASRLIQGIAGGATWTACITWLLRLYPIEQRGEALGLAVSPAVVGTIAGPAIGTVALELGVRGPYTVVAVLCLGAGGWLLRMQRPTPRRHVDQDRPDTRGDRRRLALLGAALAMAAGALIGLVNLAGPLVLVGLGAAERTAGLLFVIAAVITVGAARPLGILVDKRGAISTVSWGMTVMAVGLVIFGVGAGVVLTAICVIVVLLANNLCYISASALLSREGELAGWSLSFVTALAAVVWGIGETVGALLGGVGLDVLGDLPTASGGSAIAMAMVLLVLLIAPSRPTTTASTTDKHQTV